MPTNQFTKWRTRFLHPDAPTRDPFTVFVLSGGAINGAAQVGMLEELYSRGVTPDALVGVSAGALNAVNLATDPHEFSARMHAAWRSAARDNVFQKSSARSLWAIVRQRPSLDPGNILRQTIAKHISVDRLEECEIPVRVGTVVLPTGEMRWFDSGPAYAPLVASCSIPGIFPPVLIDGQLHVDGGVGSPVPVAAAGDFSPTRLVVLDVSLTTNERNDPLGDPTALGILLRSFEATRRRVTAAELATITPDVELIYIRAGSSPGFTTTTDHAVTALIEEGRVAAAAVLDNHPLAPRPVITSRLHVIAPRLPVTASR